MEPSPEELDAQGALGLVERAESEARSATTPSARFVYATWAIAWPVAYVARWLTAGNEPVVDAPLAGGVVFAGAILIAVVVMIAHASIRVRGISGVTTHYGRRWAVTWVAGFAASTLVSAGIGGVVSSDRAMDLIATCLATFTVALIYVSAGGVVDDDVMFSTGLWLLAVVVAAALVGPYAHLLVLGVGGAVGFIGAAVVAGRPGR